MSFKDTHIKHDRTPEEKAWVEEEIAEQEERFDKIAKAMDDLTPQREIWYQEFHDRLCTTGFNVDGDDKQVLKREELPVKPEGRVDQVVWKYGVDGE